MVSYRHIGHRYSKVWAHGATGKYQRLGVQASRGS